MLRCRVFNLTTVRKITCNAYMIASCPETLKPFASFDLDEAARSRRSSVLTQRLQLDDWILEAASPAQLDAIKSWVRNNEWFQRYQLKLEAGIEKLDASLQAQDETWPDRRTCVDSRSLNEAAIGLAKHYSDIENFFKGPAIFPFAHAKIIHRGHAIECSSHEAFMDTDFLTSRLKRSFSIDAEFVPYYYASHNYRKVLRRTEKQNIIPYILHVELSDKGQALLWIPKVAAKQGVRDDCWQAEVVVPASFEISIERVEDEDVLDCKIKHVYAKQI
jgi:hypothetical protein